MLALDADDDAGDDPLGGADRVDRVGEGQRLRRRDGDVHGPAQHGRQRGARRARADVGELAQRVELEL